MNEKGDEERDFRSRPDRKDFKAITWKEKREVKGGSRVQSTRAHRREKVSQSQWYMLSDLGMDGSTYRQRCQEVGFFFNF